jgi:hypothetical protein
MLSVDLLKTIHREGKPTTKHLGLPPLLVAHLKSLT